MQYARTLAKEYRIPINEIKWFQKLFQLCRKTEIGNLEQKDELLKWADISRSHMRLFRTRLMEAYGFATDRQVTNRIKEWRSEANSDRNPKFDHLPVVLKARLLDLSEANKTIILQNPKVKLANVVHDEIERISERFTFNLNGEHFDQVYTKTGRLRSPEQQLHRWTLKNKVSKDGEVIGDAVRVNGKAMKTVFMLMDFVDLIINKCMSSQTMAKYKERLMISAKKCKF